MNICNSFQLIPILMRCKYGQLDCEHDSNGITTYLKCFNFENTEEDKKIVAKITFNVSILN